MMADTPPVKGYIYYSEVFCADCLENDILMVPYRGKSDTPTHCAGCGVPILHELTDIGVRYVCQAIASGGCCQEVWPTVWRIIPVDSILIPIRFINLCESWAGGTDCMLRAVSSIGNLTTGTRRPGGCETDEQWYLTLWRELSGDVGYTERIARKSFLACANDIGHDDWEVLVEFEIWVNEQIGRLGQF